MAKQDTTLRYSLEIDGNKDLLAIADGLNTIGKSSSDAAPAATALLEQLKSLASQNNLITSLVNDEAALVDLGNELFLAKQKAADLQATFAATEAPTAAMSRALSNANASVASLETQYSALSPLHVLQKARTSVGWRMSPWISRSVKLDWVTLSVPPCRIL